MTKTISEKKISFMKKLDDINDLDSLEYYCLRIFENEIKNKELGNFIIKEINKKAYSLSIPNIGKPCMNFMIKFIKKD